MTTPIMTRKRTSVVTSPYFTTTATPATVAGSPTTTTTTTTVADSPVTTKINKKRETPFKIEYENNNNEIKVEQQEEEEEVEINNKYNRQTKKIKHETTTTTTTTTAGKESLAKIKWRETWDKIKIMRAKTLAPVDTLGASSFLDVDPLVKRFHVLVGCLLSSQTKDAITHGAVSRLKEHKGGLSVDSVLKMSENELETLLRPVGYYKRKAIYLKKIAEILKNKYNSDIPSTKEDIEALPGIGPKMSNLIIQIAWGREAEGIAVDVHVHRISNRLGWVKTKTPIETMYALESWLPKDRWAEINHLFVGFGQTICLPVNPKCSQCPVNDLCPVGIQAMEIINNKLKK